LRNAALSYWILLARGIDPARRIRLEHSSDLIPHVAEYLHFFFIRADGVSWIEEWPMMTIDLAWKKRASLVRVTADGDYRLDRLVEKFIHVLRGMIRQIDADLSHCFHGQRMDVASGFAPGARHSKAAPGRRAQKSLCEMTAARVTSAQDKDERE
jgi:hypothetical protein